MITKKNVFLIIIFSLFILVGINYLTGYSQNPKSSKNNGLRVYIHADMEGASGNVTFQKHDLPPGPYYEQSKILNTKEVNAAIEALLEEGVSEIVLLDDHGPGGINIDYLHPTAEVIMGQGEPITIDGSFDFQLLMSMHAMPNTPNANLCHAFSLEINHIWINGKLSGEIADAILRGSYFNVPTIFLSGDDAACTEIKELIPNVETVAVKKGLGLNAAWCLSPEKAREEIKAGVKRAIKKRNQIKLYKVEPPYDIIIEYTNSKLAENIAKRRGWARIDSSKVNYKIDDYLSRRF